MFHFASLIDSTRFATVRQALHGSRTSITHALLVSEERLLPSVAELISDDHPTDAQRAQFASWIRNGQLKVGVSGVAVHAGPDLDGRVEVDSIPDEARCRVLLLPPYFLVHLRVPLS